MNNKWLKISIIAIAGIFMVMVTHMTFTYDKVPGTDEKISSVVEEYANKAGVAKRDPYINTDKGDILLFLFCAAGLVTGFYLGYNWKDIVSGKPKVDRSLVEKQPLLRGNEKG